MKTLIFVIFSFIAFNVTAQNVLLTEYPNNDTIIPKKGPNLKKFYFVYIGYEAFADNFSDNSANIRNRASGRTSFGFKFKRKITNFWALGYDINMLSSTFSIKQNSQKTFPSVVIHKKERLMIGGLGVQIFTRFNFDRRGNTIGKYLDIGGYINWNYTSQHFTKDFTNPADSSNALTIKTTESQLNYFENYEYGVKASLGSNHFAISATYRISDLIKSKYVIYPELPKLSIGIYLALF